MKTFTSTLLLIVCLTAAVSGYNSLGAVQGSVSIPSISNIMTLIPISLNVMFNKRTIPLNITDKFTGGEIDLQGITIASIKGPSPSSIKHLDGTDSTLRLELGGISTTLKVNGSISILNLMKETLDTITITDLSIIVDVTIIPIDQDRVIYNLSVVPNITLGNLDLNTTSRIANKMIEDAHDEIMSMVAEILGKVDTAIETAVGQLNEMIATRNDTTFLVDLIGLNTTLFNITSTSIPVYKPDTNLLNFTMDGLFFDTLNQETHIHSDFNLVDLISQRKPTVYSEQNWFHQSIINSFLTSYSQGEINMNVTDANITKAFLMFMPEISSYYGKNLNLSLGVSLVDSAENIVTISKEKGFVIGNDNSQKITLTLYATTDKVTDELAAKFELNLYFHANISMENFMVYVQIPEFTISNTNLTENHCSLYDRDYNSLFNNMLQMVVDMVNNRFVDGIDLSTKIPIIGFLKNMFTEIILTPFEYEENVFFAFKYMLDQTNMEVMSQIKEYLITQ